jgi:hypothetical protein
MRLRRAGAGERAGGPEVVMSNRNQPDQAKNYNETIHKYGYARIPVNRVYQLLELTVQPGQQNYEIIRNGLFGRKVHENIYHLIKFQAMKGYSFTIWWGASLTYLPQYWNKSLKWHRTLRSARLDLFEMPWDFLIDASSSWQEQELYSPSAMQGEEAFQKNAAIMWKMMRPHILSWMDKAGTIPGVLELASGQVKRNWSGARHFPNPLFVLAFTYAKLGKVEQGRETLNRYLLSSNESEISKANLIQGFEQISHM